ncbi:MAG: hypothetical protein ACR2P1_11210, partial [Pseudomonadales bacterium]
GSKVFPGHLGAQLQGPGPEGEYHTIFRYDSVENLRRWDESTERAEWTRELDELVQGDTVVDQYVGLEFLFDGPSQVLPKYVMTMILIVVVFLMLLIVRPIVSTIFSELLGPTQQLFIAIAVQITIISYVIMPLITKLIAKLLR